jgi:chemosensory pili system protein ChpA (sensor histidine kinase/response regulator)
MSYFSDNVPLGTPASRQKPSSLFAGDTAPSQEAFADYASDIIKLFVSDIAERIKKLRKKSRSRASKIIVRFFDALSKSDTITDDLAALNISEFSDFQSFLQSAKQGIVEELVNGSQFNAYQVLTEHLDSTAQYLSDVFQNVEKRAADLQRLDDYTLHHAVRAEISAAAMLEEVSVTKERLSSKRPRLNEVTQAPQETTFVGFKETRKRLPKFVKETFSPDFGFNLAEVFGAPPHGNGSIIGSSETSVSNGAHPVAPVKTSETARPDAASNQPPLDVTPPVARKFVVLVRDAVFEQSRSRPLEPAVLAVFERLATAPDIFAELRKLSFIQDLVDFSGFLESLNNVDPNSLTPAIAATVATHLSTSLHNALQHSNTGVLLSQYALLAPVAPDAPTDVFADDDAEIDVFANTVPTAPPEEEPIPTVASLDDIAKDLDISLDVVPSQDASPATKTEPTEQDYINFVVGIFNRIKTQLPTTPDGDVAHQRVDVFLTAPDLLAALTTTTDDLFKEFAEFIGQSWVNRVALSELQKYADDIVKSLTHSLTSSSSVTTDGADIDEMLSSLKPLPIVAEEEPPVQSDALEQIAGELESSLSAPVEAALASTENARVAEEPPAATDDKNAPSIDEQSLDEIFSNPEFSLTDASLVADDMSIVKDSLHESLVEEIAKAPELPPVDFTWLALDTLEHVSLPKSSVGASAKAYLSDLCRVDDIFTALSQSPHQSLRDFGTLLLNARATNASLLAIQSDLEGAQNRIAAELLEYFSTNRAADADRSDFSFADFLGESDSALSVLDHATPPVVDEPPLIEPISMENFLLDDAAIHSLDDSDPVAGQKAAQFTNLIDKQTPDIHAMTEEMLGDQLLSESPLLDLEDNLDLTVPKQHTPDLRDAATEAFKTPPPTPTPGDDANLLADLSGMELPELDFDLGNLSDASPADSTPPAPLNIKEFKPPTQTPASMEELSDALASEMNNDLLSGEFLFDESLLNETASEISDTLKKDLSSLNDLTKRADKKDDTDLDFGDTLDDASFLLDAALDDAELLDEPVVSKPDAPSVAAPISNALDDSSELVSADNFANIFDSSDAALDSGNELGSFLLDDSTDLSVPPEPPQSPAPEKPAKKFVPDELQQIFLDEANEYLEKLNEDLLELDKVADTQQPDLVNRVLRGSHTIKGSAAMVQLRNISDLAHKMEDSLQLVRDENLKIQRPLLDVLFQSADAISTMLNTFRTTGTDAFDGKEALVETLKIYTQQLAEFGEIRADGVPPAKLAKKFVPDELQQIFLDEANEYLEKLNEDLLELDKVADTQQPDLVNRVLRGSHTIKGSAAMVQLRNISDLAHKMEDSLQLVRDENLKIQRPLLDVLFQSADAISTMLNTFRTTGTDAFDGKDALSSILKNYTEQLQQHREIKEVLTLAQVAKTKEAKTEPVETAQPQKKSGSVAEQTVRIDIKSLNSLVNLSAELVISRNRLNNELAGLSKSINKFLKERNQLGQVSKKILTAIQKGSKDGAGSVTGAFSDVLKEFSDTEFDRFSELDIISRDIKSTMLNLDDAISEIRSVSSLLNQNIVKVSNIANDLNREIVGMRMVPVKQMFTRFSRSVRDIAKIEQKDINLLTEGEETKLDKTVMEDVIEPVMHIVRNAIGHGIETPDVRVGKGKSPTGSVTIRAYQKGSRVILEVEDDGGGLPVDKIKAKALKQGLITEAEAEAMSPAAATELIFRPGFSTADKVTELQGRGVGLDVVYNTIRRLKGTTSVESVPGKGTKFIISLPLTLAIGDALLVMANDYTYAIPLEPIVETGYISTDTIEQDEDGKRYITIRDERIELRYLNDIIGYESDVMLFKAKVAVAVVQTDDGRKVAIAVEKLLGKEEIVVKTLGKHLRNVRGIIGSTILGDGQVVIILDIEYLLRSDEQKEREVYVNVAPPAEAEPEIQLPEVKRRKRKGARITVLHADDSPSVRKYVQSVLKGANIDVISADDGLNGLNKLPTSQADLVLTDLEMPRMNGFEFVSEIRKMPEFLDIPVIIVTARAGDKHRRTGLELGANAFLNKPFDPQQLIETIENFIA